MNDILSQIDEAITDPQARARARELERMMRLAHRAYRRAYQPVRSAPLLFIPHNFRDRRNDWTAEDDVRYIFVVATQPSSSSVDQRRVLLASYGVIYNDDNRFHFILSEMNNVRPQDSVEDSYDNLVKRTLERSNRDFRGMRDEALARANAFIKEVRGDE